MITLLPYESSYLPSMKELMIDTIELVNSLDYSTNQIEAWVNRANRLEAKDEEFLTTNTLLAFDKNRLVGFGNIDQYGYIDFLYIHSSYIHRGIGSKILEELEKTNNHYTVHASITAKGFFEFQGYKVVKENQVDLDGIILINYSMVKE